MSWTKRQIIEQAFEELGLAAYVFDLQPEQVESARRKLDNLVAGWSSKNIQIGYPIPTDADGSDIDEVTNVPDYAIDALVYGLAIRIAPSHGKQVSQDTKHAAHEAFQNIIRVAVSKPPQVKIGLIPSGAGNKGCNKFILNKSDNRIKAPGQDLEFFNE